MGRRGNDNSVFAVEGDNAAAVFGTGVQLREAFSVHTGGNGQLDDFVVLGNLDIIQQMGSNQLMRYTDTHIPLRKNNPVHA
ncbi:hypothetical protein D3C80_2004840 [compost metagenome]